MNLNKGDRFIALNDICLNYEYSIFSTGTGNSVAYSQVNVYLKKGDIIKYEGLKHGAGSDTFPRKSFSCQKTKDDILKLIDDNNVDSWDISDSAFLDLGTSLQDDLKPLGIYYEEIIKKLEEEFVNCTFKALSDYKNTKYESKDFEYKEGVKDGTQKMMRIFRNYYNID